MTKTPDEIKKGLACCAASYADCHRECPYKPDCDGSQILKDALAFIQQLEKDKDDQLEERELNDFLRDRVKQLEAERDAAVADIKNSRDCQCCKHYDVKWDEPCVHCDHENNCFEWRGVQKEESTC